MNQTANYDVLRPGTFFTGAAVEHPLDPDFALARAAAEGTIAAIGDLYNRHNRRVYSLCLSMTRNTAEAEDLTQEVFIQLMRTIGSFRGESQFTTWLHRLTVNQVLMHFRYLAARREELSEDLEVKILTLPKSQHSAGMPVVDRIALKAAFAELPSGCQAVFVLFDVEGYSHVEIARMLGCSVSNSKSQLHKARMKLRRLLKSGRSKRRRSQLTKRPFEQSPSLMRDFSNGF